MKTELKVILGKELLLAKLVVDTEWVHVHELNRYSSSFPDLPMSLVIFELSLGLKRNLSL